MQAVLERCDDANIGAATAHCPEQIGILARVGGAQSPLGGHDVDREEVVAGEAVLTAQPAEATTEGEPGDARRRDSAHRRGEAERLAFTIELRKREARLGADRAACGIHAAAFHRREVDQESAVRDGLAGCVVATATRRDREPVRLRESNARDDVSGTNAFRDQHRPVLDHRIEHLPGLVVRRIAGY